MIKLNQWKFNEVIGDLVQLKPNHTATSMIEITTDSVFRNHQ